MLLRERRSKTGYTERTIIIVALDSRHITYNIHAGYISLCALVPLGPYGNEARNCVRRHIGASSDLNKFVVKNAKPAKQILVRDAVAFWEPKYI